MHSVIRRHTAYSATEEQLKESIKAVFGTSQRQSNFKSIFTPPKNYVVSRIQLKYLQSRVANVLVSIFTRIADSPEESQHFPRHKGQKKDCEKYMLPARFGETSVKSYFHPLGFQCKQKHNAQRRCDSLTCTLTREEPWSIFEACWHSFHNQCLAEKSYCTICKMLLEDVVKSLSTSAIATLLHDETNNEEDCHYIHEIQRVLL